MDDKNTEPEVEQIQVLPLVALRDTVIFPEMIVPLQVGRDRSVKALDRAVRTSQPVALITQRSNETEEVNSVDELYTIGTLAKIAQVIRLQDGTIRAIVQGQKRIRLLDLVQTEPHLEARIELIDDEQEKSLEVEALMASVQGQIEQYVSSGASVPPEVAVAARNISDGGLLADMVAYSPDMTTEARQQLLETIDVAERLRTVGQFLAKQIEVLELKGRIQSEVKSEMDKTQREYILREQLKAIQKELGEDDPAVAEAGELKTKVEESAMPADVKEKALKEVDRLNRIPSASPEQGVIRTYVDWLVSLPWGVQTDDNLDLDESEKVLNEDHYGLEKPKERILEYMAVRKLADKIRSPILLFVGPPGVGKTSLGKSIARAMGRKFVRMSPRSVAIGAPTSVPFRDASSRASRPPSPRTRSSCSTRSTRSGWTSAAIRHRRCWRCSTPSRTTPSRTTILRCRSTCHGSSSSPPPTWSTPFRRPCATGWRSSSCRATRSSSGCASRSGSCSPSSSRTTA
jgi:ATP-dependent Lon protease